MATLRQFAVRHRLAGRPEFILLHCGADSLDGDPITHLRFSEAAHAHAAARLCAIAGPPVLVERVPRRWPIHGTTGYDFLAMANGFLPPTINLRDPDPECDMDFIPLEGRAVVRDDPDAVADAERRYAQRYRTPRVNPARVVLEIALTRVLGSR